MRKFFVIFLLICFSGFVKAQQEQFKAVFIYSVTRHIDWPQSTLKDKFVIGVIGESVIVKELREIALEKKVYNLPISIIAINSDQAIPSCNVLFVPKDKGNDLGRITKLLAGKPVLIISDESNGCRLGAAINFTLKNQNLNFEINRNNILSRGLNVSSQLISLGKSVE